MLETVSLFLFLISLVNDYLYSPLYEKCHFYQGVWSMVSGKWGGVFVYHMYIISDIYSLVTTHSQVSVSMNLRVPGTIATLSESQIMRARSWLQG